MFAKGYIPLLLEADCSSRVGAGEDVLNSPAD